MHESGLRISIFRDRHECRSHACAHPPGQQKSWPTGSSIQARAYAGRVLARVRTRASTERELSSSDSTKVSLALLFSDPLPAPARRLKTSRRGITLAELRAGLLAGRPALITEHENFPLSYQRSHTPRAGGSCERRGPNRRNYEKICSPYRK